MSKALKMQLSTRRRIGEYKKKHPNATIGEIAKRFNCTYNQARNAIKQYDAGMFNRDRPPKKDLSNILKNNTTEELLKKQYDKALAQLEVDDGIMAADRISYLDKLANINKSLQQVSLQNHLKRADAEVIARIIRRYEPEADDARIIAVYREEMERWKNSQ